MRVPFKLSVYALLLGVTLLPAREVAGSSHSPCSVSTPLAPATGPLLLRDTLPDTITVSEIYLYGHKRTRSNVIFREMEIKKGSRYAAADLDAAVERSYATLMNTGLFVSAELRLTDSLLPPDERALVVKLNETWYLYPVPEFSLADRNFNVWWTEQDRSLDRVNIGGKLTYYNFTGRRDRLRLRYTTGYTQRYSFSYGRPYLNRNGTLGASVSYGLSRRREQNFATRDNRQEFYLNEDAFVFRSTAANLNISYRRALYVSHDWELGYRDQRIADTIARTLNPEFFGEGRAEQRFFRLAYTYTNDRRDVRNYPWKGMFLRFSLIKDGLRVTRQRDGLTAGMTYRKFWAIDDKWSFNAGLAGKYSLIRSRQPFLENRAIGFGSNGLVGYQFYVVDGLDMAIWRAGIRRQLWSTELDLGRFAFIKAFRHVPMRFLLSAQVNQGITNSPFIDGEVNPLTNTLLTGGSLGLDAVFYFDMVGSLQYNRNHLGEDGIFLALSLNF